MEKSPIIDVNLPHAFNLPKPLDCYFPFSSNSSCAYKPLLYVGLPSWLSGKESVCQCKRCNRNAFDPCIGKLPWSRKWQPVPVFLLGKSHGQKSLTSYSPWGHKESDTTAYSTLLNRSFFQGPVSRALLTTRGLVQSNRNQLLLIFLTF